MKCAQQEESLKTLKNVFDINPLKSKRVYPHAYTEAAIERVLGKNTVPSAHHFHVKPAYFKVSSPDKVLSALQSSEDIILKQKAEQLQSICLFKKSALAENIYLKYSSRERAYSCRDNWQGYLSLHLNAPFPACVEGMQMPGRKLITIFIDLALHGLVLNCKCLYQSSPSEKQRAIS